MSECRRLEKNAVNGRFEPSAACKSGLFCAQNRSQRVQQRVKRNLRSTWFPSALELGNFDADEIML